MNKEYFLNEFKIILSLAENIFKSLNIENEIDIILKNKIPIISMEGIPGSGKTTQIEIVENYFNSRNIKCAVLELPAGDQSSKLLRFLYKNPDFFSELEKNMPWFNSFFLTVQLYVMMKKFIEEKNDIIIMSRGLISTIYYNINSFKKAGFNEDESFTEMMRIFEYFIKPEYIIYLKLPVEISYQRVISRNRLPLRKLDTIDGLIEIENEYKKIFSKLSSLKVFEINANQSKECVSREIIDILNQEKKD